MELLSKELIQELLSADQSPCLSLYLPTHQKHPENLQDIILFKNLIQQLEESLMQKYSSDEVQKHLESVKALIDNDDVWNHTLDGLAVFSASGMFKVVVLHKSVEELAMVADSFHTKPLWQYLQSVDHFHLLGLTLRDIRLFEGNRHSLTEVKLTADTPKTITEALGDELTEKHSTVDSYGGTGGESTAMHHGHGGKKEETEKDEKDLGINKVFDDIESHDIENSEDPEKEKQNKKDAETKQRLLEDNQVQAAISVLKGIRVYKKLGISDESALATKEAIEVKETAVTE